jgi:hypothetical protein
VVGAEDERHGVEQKDGRLGLVSHGTSLSLASCQRWFLWSLCNARR